MPPVLDLETAHNKALKALIRFAKGEYVSKEERTPKIERHPRGKILKKLRLHGRYCYWCDNPLNSKSNSPKCHSIDHMIPRAFGGPNHRHNYVLSCHQCNSERKDGINNKEAVYKFFGVTEEEVLKHER